MSQVSTLKTRANQEEVSTFLKNTLDLQVLSLAPIQGGEIALAYEVSTDSSSLIFRLGPNISNFEKDRAAHDCYNSQTLPIPAVLKVGKYNEKLSFALSEKVTGLRLDKLDSTEKTLVRPSLIATLAAIHTQPIPEQAGFGYWTAETLPAYKNWAEFLIESTAAQLPVGRTTEDSAQIKEWHQRFLKLCEQVPNLHHLVHADFSFDNILAKSNIITGVIDWAGSMFGDPLYDLAWLVFWYDDKTFLSDYLNTAVGKNIGQLNSEQRLECYILRTGLTALKHFERSNQGQAFDWTVRQVRKVVGLCFVRQREQLSDCSLFNSFLNKPCPR